MKLHVKAKVKFIEPSYGYDHLRLFVSTKIPGRTFKLKSSRTLCTARWIGDEEGEGGYKNYEEFLKDTVTCLRYSEVNIIPKAKELVFDMIKNDKYVKRKGNLKTEVKELLKNNKKFEFDIEIEDK